MGKLFKGVVKFTVAAATVTGVCYLFKDKIKQSKFYQEYDVDGKLDKVKNTIIEKLPKSDVENEEDIVDDDEIFFEEAEADTTRDYVSLDAEHTAGDSEESSDDEATDEEASNNEEDVPTIDM
ncbi:MAG: hypothetical protein ACI4D8_09330 [Wujia sp.]